MYTVASIMFLAAILASALHQHCCVCSVTGKLKTEIKEAEDKQGEW